MEETKFIVYKHTSPSNKVYIGVTCQLPHKRWKHGHGYFKNGYFTRAIKKYGWDNFQHDILCTDLTKSQAEFIERYLIRLYESANREFGYNIDLGGSLSGKHSEETCRKISESRLGEKHPLYGKHISEETRRKMSEAQKGKIFSEEHRRKLSECQLGEKHYRWGRPYSDAEKKKYSDAAHKRAVAQIDMATQEIIKIFDGVRIASRETNINNAGISLCCNGKISCSGGYIWRFVDQIDKEVG